MDCIDLIVLFAYLISVLALGWHFRHGDGPQEHFLAGRKMGALPIGLSIMVTSFSAINYVAIPEEIVGHGLYVIVSFPVFFLAAWPISKIWMPYFHRLRATTVYEFLETRYDGSVRRLACVLFLCWRFGWMAIALYVSGKILSVFSGWSPLVMIALCGLVATAYTSVGGVRAVMWTDVLQFIVLFSGIAFGVCHAYGTSGVSLVDIVYEGGRLMPFAPFDEEFLSFDPRVRMTLWSGLFGVFTAFMARYGADQVVMQRYFTAKDLKSAQRGIWLNAFASMLSLSLLACLGLAVYGYAVKTGALELGVATGRGTALKQLALMVKSFPTGVTGLIVSGILAATMSSIDSGINACSAGIVNDFPMLSSRVRSSRWMTFGLGLTVTVLAVVLLPYLNKHQSLFAVINKLVNGLGSPLLALVVLGMFSRWTTARGVFWGGVLGLLGSLGVSFFVKPLALQYYAVANLIVTLGCCYGCSALDKVLSSKRK